MLTNTTTPTAHFRVGKFVRQSANTSINSLTAYLSEILRNLGEIVREFRFFDDEETVLIRLN